LPLSTDANGPELRLRLTTLKDTQAPPPSWGWKPHPCGIAHNVPSPI
jgi:hypothetical protein